MPFYDVDTRLLFLAGKVRDIFYCVICFCSALYTIQRITKIPRLKWVYLHGLQAYLDVFCRDKTLSSGRWRFPHYIKHKVCQCSLLKSAGRRLV